MDGTESLVKGFTVDMDPQEATALQEKVEVSRRSYTVSGPPSPLRTVLEHIPVACDLSCFSDGAYVHL